MPSKKSISTKLRQKVAKRAKYLCEYCKSPQSYSPGPFDMEHIIPLSEGGNSNYGNLAYSCNGCNGHKYNKTKALDPVDEILTSLFNPIISKWKEHFAWNEEGQLVIGITSTGRATVEALK